MSNNLSRRDFLKLAGATSAGFALSTCGVKATELPMATPTLTNTPAPTPLIELTPTKDDQLLMMVERIPSHLDRDGNVDQWIPHPNPRVLFPDPALDEIPADIDITKLTYKLEIFNKYSGMKKSVRVYAFNEDKTPVITAKFDEGKRTWYWEEITLNDYTDLLTNLLKKDYTFGTNFVLPNTLPEYRKMIRHHFNAIFETWTARMDILQSEQNKYNTKNISELVNLTKKSGLHLTIAGPVWQYSGFMPEWFKKITDTDEVIRIYNEATLKVVQACGDGKNIDFEIMEPVRGITVEGNVGWRYFMEGNPYRPNPPYITPENDLRWIEEPLRTARNANPKIRLFIDQYSLEFDGPTNDQFYPLVQQILNDGAPLDGINFQGMVNAEEILQDVEGKMAQLTANIKKYQALGLEVGCPSLKVFSKGGIDQTTIDSLWYKMVKTFLESGIRRISCWTDDTSVHPLVLEPDERNDTDVRNSVYSAVAKAYEEYYLQHQ